MSAPYIYKFPNHKSQFSLESLLEEVGLRVSGSRLEITLNSLLQRPRYRKHLLECLEDLKVTDPEFTLGRIKDLRFSLNLLNLDFKDINCLLEDVTFFNSYRLKTLRNSFFDDFQKFNLSQYKAWCRSKEGECMKAGLTNELWKPPIAEKIFGPSAEKGDFGEGGSSGWKLLAFLNFALDLYDHLNGLKLLRIAPYEHYMKDSQLETVEVGLKSNSDSRSLKRFFARKLGYPLPED